MLTRRILSATYIMVLLYGNTYAQQKEKVAIEHATIFLNGAELASTAKLTLPQGETEILFTNIAGNVNQQSLNIGATNGVVIQSSSFRNDYLEAEVTSPRVKALKDSIEMIEDGRLSTNNQLSAVNEQITILSQNKQVGGANTGLSVAELAKMLDLVKARMVALLNEKDKLTATYRKTDERLTLLRRQLEIEQQKDFQPGGQLLVKFYAPRATSTNINIAYIVPNAGWTPSYDLRVDDLKDPVKLYYKANVYQNSGVSWNKVKLTLSTGNPTEGAQAPTLRPWYLAFYQPKPYGYENSRNANSIAATSAGVYQQKAGAELNLGGAREDGTAYIIDGVRVYGSAAIPKQSTMDNYVQTDNSGINTSFDIDLPYTIPSDGQAKLVAVKVYELPATYRYYSVPKMDRDVFLQAQITNWEDLNLLPAATNIFYEGSYVGEGFIDVRNTKDTMNLSLGRDKKIVVRRERDKELRSVKTIGSNIRETFVYTIDVRNTRKDVVNITIMDQIPVSNDKDIVIEDIEANGGEYDETTGAVKWTVKLNPNETIKKKIGFTVKYPKGKQLNL